MLIKSVQMGIRRGGQEIINDVSFTLDPGQRIGVSGRNGCGKSTLIRLIADEEPTDSGSVEYRKDLKMVALHQHGLEPKRSAIDFVLDGHTTFRQAERNKDEAVLSGNAERIALAEERFAHLDGYRLKSEAARILAGLGFANDLIDNPLGSFSGGWQQRLLLARVLIQPADVFLLDEPTNHLDIEAIDWLARWLVRQPAAVIVIDHGRSFLQAVSTHTLLMRFNSAKLYKGHIGDALRQAAAEQRQRELEAERINKKRQELEKFITRFRAKATKAAQAQSRQKALDKLQDVVSHPIEPIYDWTWKANDIHAGPLIRLDRASAGYGNANVVLKNVSLSIECGERIGIVGVNGSGKSTLIKLLTGSLDPLDGDKWSSPRLAANLFAQDAIEQLPLSDTPLHWFGRQQSSWREQRARDYLGGFGLGKEELSRRLDTLSGGERARLVLAHMAACDSNLVVLDEPTNHLDMTMRTSLSLSLQGYEGAVLVISHDRDVLSQLVDRIIVVDGGEVREFNDSLDAYLKQRNQSLDGSTEARDAGVAEHSKRAKRQEAARKRSQQAPLRNRMKKLESKLDELQNELARIDTTLAEPTLYESDEGIATSQALAVERRQCEHDAAVIESEWLEIAEQLEADG